MHSLLFTTIHGTTASLAIYAAVLDRSMLMKLTKQTTFQCISVALLLLAVQWQHTSTSWHDCLFLFATVLTPILAAHPKEYINFVAQMATLADLYRAVTCSYLTFGQQVVYAVVKCFLFIKNLDQLSLDAINSLILKMLYVDEFKFLLKYKAGSITLDDIPQLGPRFNTGASYNDFRFDVNEPMFLNRAIIRMVWKPLLPLYIVKFLVDNISIVQAMLNSYMLYCFKLNSVNIWYQAYAVAFLLLLIKIINSKSITCYDMIQAEWNRVRNALYVTYLKQALSGEKCSNFDNLKAKTAFKYTTNLSQLMTAVLDIFSIITRAWILSFQIGMLVVVPTCVYIFKIGLKCISSKLKSYDNPCKSSHHYRKDDIISNIYKNIRPIKYFSWEPKYLNTCTQELSMPQARHQWRSHVIYAFTWAIDYVVSICDQLAPLLTFIIHIYGMQDTDPSIVISDYLLLTNLINGLRFKINRLGVFGKKVNNVLQNGKAVEKFLKGDYINTITRIVDKKDNTNLHQISLDKCGFTWHGAVNKLALFNVSLTAAAGELIAIKGPTGSGKSTLLLSICGEVEMVGGSGFIKGKIGYLEQTPWLIDATVKENILLGREYNDVLYNKVIHACAFADDFAQWPQEDNTVIGNQGINLSGGQKSRLALARTLYSQADVYIMDDPLSAVDAHVRRHIMEHVILDTGMLKDKLRIVSTNTNHIVPFAHQVVTLDNGQASVTTRQPKLYKPLSPPLVSLQRTADEQKWDNNPKAISSIALPKPADKCVAASRTALEGLEAQEWSVWENIKYIIKLCGPSLFVALLALGLVSPIIDYVVDGYIIQLFHQDSNSNNQSAIKIVVAYTTYKISGKLIKVMAYKLKMWFKHTFIARENENKLKHIFINGLIHAPLTLFDSISESYVVPAYNNSTKFMVSSIHSLLTYSIPLAATIIIYIFNVMCQIPLLLPLVFILIVLLVWKTMLRDGIAKNISKLKYQAIEQQGNVYSYIANGRNIIRINSVENYFIHQFMILTDKVMHLTHTVCLIGTLSSNITLLVIAISDFLVLVTTILYSQVSKQSIPLSSLLTIQLLIKKLADSANQLYYSQENITKLSQNITKLRQFASIKPEAPYVVQDCRPAEHWPEQGKIEFSNFSLKYHPDLPWSVKDINLTIQPGEKVGIVGRTGAGKSTLVKSLFRLVPDIDHTVGFIFIDGQDISKLGVGDLRPCLGIIPQETTMFSGTFRENLDPMQEYSVEDIWAALIKCNINDIVRPSGNQADKLLDQANVIPDEHYHQEIARQAQWKTAGWLKRAWLMVAGEKPQHISSFSRWFQQYRPTALDRTAENARTKLSSGQQQLFSLCRLLMRKQKIVVLDEATANVDLETDADMQRLIKNEFSQCTVLTIAHRLETVMHSDRVIVMDKGKIVETGSPAELMQRNGYFAELVRTNDFGQ